MFGLSGPSSSMLAGKRRCAVCGTKRMSYRHDGRLMCRYGHEQAGVIEEEAEGIIEGSTRRHMKRTKRESKKQQERDRRMYGRNAHFLILQAMQHIIKLQATKLVQNEGVPEPLIGAVRSLWLLYVSKLEDIDDAGVAKQGAEAAKEMGVVLPSAGTQEQDGLASGEMSSQFTQSQDGGGDTSLDLLLQRVDEDIARDEAEILEWEQEQGNDMPGLSQSEGQTDTEYDTDIQDTIERPKRGRVKKADRMKHSPGLKDLEGFVRLEFLPAIVYLAFMWLRLPVSLADLYYMMADERIPYVSAYQYVPSEITSRMGEGVMSLLHGPYAPSVFRLQKTVAAFELFYQKHYEIAFPMPDAQLVLLSILKRLGLGVELYPMAMKIAGIANKDLHTSEECRYIMHLSLTAGIIVCLKLHYGLDEVERTSPPGTAGLDMPPLHEFLAKWRNDWVSELSIGAIPHMTAYGERWEKDFAEYYKRLTYRSEIPRYKASFKVLGAKYSQIINSLADSSSLSAESAARLLPPAIACRFQQASPEQQSEHEQPASDASDFGELIDPLGRSKHLRSSDSGKQELPLMSFVEPFDHHPELWLRRGESN
ncbi:hypothetical protein GGF43_004249 [Coemansia sp. RSA 2618]|nr:hypothetical protein GGF43_004249 [Coemansia sp. RSA 2618]